MPQELAVEVHVLPAVATQQTHTFLVQEMVLVSFVQFQVRIPHVAKLSVSDNHHTQDQAVEPQIGSV